MTNRTCDFCGGVGPCAALGLTYIVASAPVNARYHLDCSKYIDVCASCWAVKIKPLIEKDGGAWGGKPEALLRLENTACFAERS